MGALKPRWRVGGGTLRTVGNRRMRFGKRDKRRGLGLPYKLPLPYKRPAAAETRHFYRNVFRYFCARRRFPLFSAYARRVLLYGRLYTDKQTS